MRMFVGIDPGLSGGIAVIRDRGAVVSFAKFKGRTEQEISDLFSLIRVESAGYVTLYLEKVHAMPRQGVSSTFKFGTSYGFLRGLATAHGFQIQDVTPQAWQKALDCMTKGDKNVTKNKARQLFPALANLITHAVADALLIAAYAEQTFYKGKS